MTLDKEFDVAVEAVKLVISILRYHRDMLTDKVSDQVSISSASAHADPGSLFCAFGICVRKSCS